jgi:hypothetical protein
VETLSARLVSRFELRWTQPADMTVAMSRHLQLRLEKLPAEVQAIGWKAQVRLCKRCS